MVLEIENVWSRSGSRFDDLISADRCLVLRVSSYQIYLQCISRGMNDVFSPLTEHRSRSALSMFIACRPTLAVSLSTRAIKSTILYPIPSRDLPSIRRCGLDGSLLLEIARPRRPGCISEQKLFPKARRRFSSSPVALHGHLDPPKPGEE